MNKPIVLASCLALSGLSVFSNAEDYSPFYIVASPSVANLQINKVDHYKASFKSASSTGFRIGAGVNVRNDSTAALGFEAALASLGSYSIEGIDVDINAVQLAVAGQIPVSDIGIGISIRGGINRWYLEADFGETSTKDSSIGYFYEFGPYYNFGHFNVSLAYTDMIISGDRISATRNGFTTNFTYQF